MFTSTIRSHSSILRRSSGACGISPALLIITSIRPYACTAASTNFLTSSQRVTSVVKAIALPPLPVNSRASDRMRSSRRAPNTTPAPSAERSRALASPRPLLAPVMTTTFPRMLLLMILDLGLPRHLSATRQSLQVFRVPRPLHGDLRGGALDLAQILRRELDGERADVFLQTDQLRGAWDRYDPRLLSKQPGERNLSRRRLLPFGDVADQIDQGLVSLERLGGEARQPASEVVALEGRFLIHRAGQVALAERAVRDEADPEFLEHGQRLLFGTSPPQGIFALERRDRLDRVGAADCSNARLRKPEVLNLALPDQVLDCARHVFDRHVGIDTMLIEEVDDIDL